MSCPDGPRDPAAIISSYCARCPYPNVYIALQPLHRDPHLSSPQPFSRLRRWTVRGGAHRWLHAPRCARAHRAAAIHARHSRLRSDHVHHLLARAAHSADLNARPEFMTLPVVITSLVGDVHVFFNMMMAICLLALLPTVILVVLLQRYVVEGLAAGAVKG